MRRVIVLGLLLAFASSADAAERVTVAQLEQAIATGMAPRKAEIDSQDSIRADLLDELLLSDELANRLRTLELAERLTPATLSALLAKYNLGPRAQFALELLSDESAFLDPPANELPQLPPPTAEEQHRMLKQAGGFVFSTLAHLPDFFARLSTTHFTDAAASTLEASASGKSRLRVIGTSVADVTFRDGREVLDSAPRNVSGQRTLAGLHSQGEFGAEAAIVFLDLANGTIAFHHWEKGIEGPVAVFRYSVPRAASHYEVKYSCEGKLAFRKTPAYSGTFSIVLATGSLARFTVQADWDPGDPITHVASAIEYGPVTLGDKVYACPQRSVAFTVDEAYACTRNGHYRKLDPPVAMLNRIVFTDYHRLGSEARIVSGPDNTSESDPAHPKVP